MSSIPQKKPNENEVSDFVTKFITEFHVGKLLFKCNPCAENFSKNTIYRFLNSIKTNWYRFTTLLSARIICDFMKPLTDNSRKDVFIIDDNLFDRSRSKNTELLAKVFDHCSMKYKLGYRMLTLGWSDGNSFVPAKLRR